MMGADVFFDVMRNKGAWSSYLNGGDGQIYSTEGRPGEAAYVPAVGRVAP
jgi:hypothetical protein